MFGLESEVADDFSLCPGGPYTITGVTGYGGYFDWAPGDPDVPAYNLHFYSDASGTPGSEIATFLHRLPDTLTYVGDDIYGAPCYKIEFDITIPGIMGAPVVYWFGLQASDHWFPPRWGRQEADSLFGEKAMFRSAYFGYPEWIAVAEAFGTGSDVAQEFG
jgi:hypothetical protein